MRLLDRKHIDLEKWDNLVAQSGATVFSTSAYLDAVAQNWCVLVDDEYSKGIAIPYTNRFNVKIAYTPVFLRYVELIHGDFDEHVMDLIKSFFPIGELNLRHVTVHGNSKHFQELKAAYKKIDIKADCRAYLDNIEKVYEWADFVIARSGALTVSEFSAAGIPSLLVPFPFAVDNHQFYNAKYLSDKKAARLIIQEELTTESLRSILRSMTRNECLKMAKAALENKATKPEEVIYKACERLINK